MSRHLLLVLLLATGVALGDEKPQSPAQHAASTAEVQPKSEAAQAKTEVVETKTESAQRQPEPAQAQTEQAQANTEEAQAADGDAKLTSVPGSKALGMSILGNQDAPKSLVIVPWKSSELGQSPGISTMLDDSRQPVDKEVFMRALRYYEIRSTTKQ